MRDIIYEELRRNCAESIKLTAEQIDKLLNAIKNVIIFHITARREGLLWLEMGRESLDKETEDRYFSELLMLVVDGTDPELIKEYAFSRYFAANLTGYEGIIYLIYIKGALMIYEGVNPVIVEHILVAMLPENVRKLYIEKKNVEAENEKKSERKDLKDKIESICNKNPDTDEKEHTLLSEASIIFENRTDQVIQRILREVDMNDLAVALKGLSGNACRRIFKNLSKRLAVRIADDMEYMGPVRISDVNEIVIKIMNVVLKLAKAGEVDEDDLIAIKVVMDIYNSDREVCNMYKGRYSRLKQALDDIWKG